MGVNVTCSNKTHPRMRITKARRGSSGTKKFLAFLASRCLRTCSRSAFWYSSAYFSARLKMVFLRAAWRCTHKTHSEHTNIASNEKLRHPEERNPCHKHRPWTEWRTMREKLPSDGLPCGSAAVSWIELPGEPVPEPSSSGESPGCWAAFSHWNHTKTSQL